MACRMGVRNQEGMKLMMKRHKLLPPVIGVMMAGALLAGCGSPQSNASREVIDKPGKQITVIDTAAEGRKNTGEIQVEQIEKLKDVYGRTWLSDHEAIVERNHVLMIHDFASNIERKLTENPATAGQYLAAASPDGEHVFFTGGNPKDKYDIGGYLLDAASGTVTKTGAFSMLSDMFWADPQHVLVSTDDSKLQLIDLQGKRTPVQFSDPELSDNVPRMASKAGDRYYYLGVHEGYTVLKSFTASAPEAQTIQEGVVTFSLSPDGSAIALEKREWNTTKDAELQLIDASGKKLGTVAKGTLLGRPSWSPDGSKIAFSVYTEGEQGMKGMYVFDKASGKTTPLSTEIQAYDSPAVWSPDGKSLMVYQTVYEGENSNNVTYVVHLK